MGTQLADQRPANTKHQEGTHSIAIGEHSNDVAPPPRKRPSLPPPSFSQAAPGFTEAVTELDSAELTGDRARALAVAAAQAAAASALPGQRDRAIAEAASLAYGEKTEIAPVTGDAAAAVRSSTEAAAPAKNAAAYTPPSWSGTPDGVPYTLEVMKGGQIVEKRRLAGRSHFTFGRSPQCEMLLEHPSISRLHAVIQFRASDAACFAYDCGSAHGTSINKRRLKPHVHAPLRVGDMLRLGSSSRVLILGGPEDLMPEEGLSKTQRRTLAAMEAKEARKDREQAMAQVEMQRALKSGVSWGMADEDATAAGEDVGDAALGPDGVLDWRSYSQTHGLTEKQQKLAAKIRRCENRLHNLRRETDAIQTKQKAMEELTAGQAGTLARNEQVMDKTAEEIEDLEEVLTESITDSIRGKRQKAEAAADGSDAKAQRSKRKAQEEDDDASGDSSGDEFYDRTAGHGGAHALSQAAPAGKRQKPGEAVEAEDAASLFGKREALREECVKLAAVVAAEQERERTGNPSPDEAQQQQGDADTPAADPLDAFMSNVASSIEHDKVERLQRQLRERQAEVSRCERLLKLADPDGYFKEGTRAAADAKARGSSLLAAERSRKEAAAVKLRQQQDAAARKAQEAAFVPEEEEEEDPPLTAAQPAAAQSSPAQAEQAAAASKPSPGAPSPLAHPQGLDDCADSSQPGLQLADVQPAPGVLPATPAVVPPAGQQPAAAAPGGMRPGLNPQKRPSAPQQAQQQAAAEAGRLAKREKLLADLRALQGAHGVEAGQGGEAGEGGEWQPPSGQLGDGKTALNEKLGY